MDAGQFNILVKNPAELKDTPKDELRRTLNQYPYCQSLRLLYLKKLQLEQHPEFNNELSKTAAYTNDRKALYKLIYEPYKFEKEYVLHKAAIEIPETSATTSGQALIEESIVAAEYYPEIETPEVENREQVEFDKHPEDSLLEMENASANEHELELQEDFILMAEKSGDSELSTDFDNLEEENDEDLVDEHESAEIDAIKALEAEIEEHQHAKEEALSVENGLVATDVEEPIRIDVLETPAPGIIERAEASMQEAHTGEKSFLGWLKTIQGEESKVRKVVQSMNVTSFTRESEPLKTSPNFAPSKKLENEPEEELDVIYRTEIQIKQYDFEKLPEVIEEEIKSIDEFVIESHQHKALPKEYKDISVSELAKRSLEENEEVITETMARILAEQGKFKRAVEITEKLILLYPEKRAYFADLLDEFNKKIK